MFDNFNVQIKYNTMAKSEDIACQTFVILLKSLNSLQQWRKNDLAF